MGMSVLPTYAATPGVTFTPSDELVYSGVTDAGSGTVDLGDTFAHVAPGETRTMTIDVSNNNAKTSDFYMSTDVLKALEDTKSSAAGAAYDIKLTAAGTTLYDSTLGGYVTKDGTSTGSNKGLGDLSAALGDYVLISTLANGEKAQVVLTIYFNGEAMDSSTISDYTNTLGQMGFNFKVGYQDPSADKIYKIIDKNGEVQYVTVTKKKNPILVVATGDETKVGLAIAVVILGAILVVIGNKKRSKEVE